WFSSVSVLAGGPGSLAWAFAAGRTASCGGRGGQHAAPVSGHRLSDVSFSHSKPHLCPPRHGRAEPLAADDPLPSNASEPSRPDPLGRLTVLDSAARVNELRPTAVNAVLQEARQLQAQGRALVSLMRGQPDTPTPPHIVEAAHKALRDGRTG